MQTSPIRAAVFVSSVFALYISAAMLIPAAVDIYYGNADWQVFAFCAMTTGGLGLIVAAATRSRPPIQSTRFAFLLVALLWVTLGLVGAIPFYAASLKLNIADSVFESVSAITTTGSTTIAGLDNVAPGLLLWRSLLQWIGGLGVIALGLFLLPFLNVGGFSYFQIESSDIDERPFERFSTFMVALLGIYASLTVLCAIAYAAAGMSSFDAVNHAMTTLATGGFSTHDASFGYFEGQAVLWIGTIFMLVGAIPFSILILLAVRGRLDALRDPQIRVFLGYVAAFALTVAIYRRVTADIPFGEALAHSAFNFVSIITTTGFASEDYSLWGPYAVVAAFFATFLGGCSGSTAGGIKAYRFYILAKMLANGLRQLIHPHVVQSIRYGSRTVDADMQRSVVLFMTAFMLAWVASTMALAAGGLDFVTASTAALTAITNVGPGLGDLVGPAGNFVPLDNYAKWILSFMMLLGRLEIVAVLVLLMPSFWRN
ncbi:trk system potassium uptake protein TrkH [Mesorhizobium sp. J18]|uniref:TrkH family potassium uptake protein n=1 Tax=Mesorhizobium sp. J18 TaxID=935263 RepID=UPI001199D7C9|nr:TrkH family potassium uptake protein [Mesorhizobium sp. J18]TWH01270.1 trk system potassium uptake protein TrkH [Mesorhizobium sp. J18]